MDTNLLREYKLQLAAKDTLKIQLSAVNQNLDELGAKILQEFSADEITKVSDEEGATFFVSHRTSAKISDRDAFMAWVSENKLEDCLTVNSQTLAKLSKDFLDEHGAFPEGVDVSVIDKLSVRGARV